MRSPRSMKSAAKWKGENAKKKKGKRVNNYQGFWAEERRNERKKWR